MSLPGFSQRRLSVAFDRIIPVHAHNGNLSSGMNGVPLRAWRARIPVLRQNFPMEHPKQQERQSLKDETLMTIEEARMVLPGIQAIFGFQLIAIFNAKFDTLTHAQRLVHLSAMALTALAIVLIMAPAAFHRIGQRGWVSRELINIASNLLTAGMMALMLGLSLEFGLVAALILSDVRVGAVLGAVLFLVLLLFWVLLPLRHRTRA